MSAAFAAVFAVFVVAMVGVAVSAIRWGLRRDRVERARRAADAPGGASPGGTGAPGGRR